MIRAGAYNANKFRAVRTVVDNITFDSKREAEVYAELKLREKAKEITGPIVHPKWRIDVCGVHIAVYTADFLFYEAGSGVQRVIDVKSPPTARKRDFVLIRKLMKAVHGVDIEIWT